MADNVGFKEIKVKNTFVLLVAILATTISQADQGPGSEAYIFTIASPSNTFYAVQSHIPQYPFCKKLRQPESVTNRFQVFSSTTGVLVWQAIREWGYGSVGELMLADDGEHVISLSYWISLDVEALNSLRGSLKLSDDDRTALTSELRKSLDRLPVITFYNRDKVLAKVFFRDLDFPLKELRDISPSHTILHHHHFRRFYSSAQAPGVSGTTITITFVDGKSRTFDFTNGAIIKTEVIKDYTPPSCTCFDDPFSAPLSLSTGGSIQQSDALNPQSPSAPGVGGR